MHDGSRTLYVWTIPAIAALHNLEEALAVSRLGMEALMPRVGPALLPTPTIEQFFGIAGLATLLPVLLALATRIDRLDSLAFYALVVFQATMGLNVVPHLVGTVTRGGYHPGVATASLLQVPFTALLLHRSARRGWLSDAQWWGLAPAVLAVHGPVFLALVWGTTRLGG